jgi:Domain of unknown function (DUF4406)
MRIYIAGPMRGYPEFNFPAFHAAEKKLAVQGHQVFSPAARDIQVHGEGVNNSSTGNLADVPQFSLREALAADLEYICLLAEAVVVLPGWEKSMGAMAEVATARALDLPVYTLNNTRIY